MEMCYTLHVNRSIILLISNLFLRDSLFLYCNHSIVILQQPEQILTMDRSLKKYNNQQAKPQQESDSIQRSKLASSHLRSIFTAITKRISYLALSKLIANVGKHNLKWHKLKLVAHLSQRCAKDKKMAAFNRLRAQRQHHLMHVRTVKNLGLIMKRLAKHNLSFALSQLKGRRISFALSNIGDNKPEIRSSFKSARRSQSSNALSVSEESLNQSRSMIFVDDQCYSQQEVQKMLRENEQLRRMVLSEEVRQGLLKMQRFDRYNYSAWSESLKQPIAAELRRLQKMKNQIKSMRSKFYDNELTVTCLFNHSKLISQMDKQLQDYNALKQKTSDLQSRLAEANSQHRKQIAEYKRKLLFFDVGAGRDKSAERESMAQPRIMGENEAKAVQFNSEQQTTFSFMIAALKNRRYKDARRQIQHFTKKSKKESFVTILKEVLALIEDRQALETNIKQLQKSKTQTVTYMAQFDKFLRNDKPQQLQRIKNKCKTQASFMQLSYLLQSIISFNAEVRRLRKKESDSADRQMKSAEKQRFKKNVQNQNEQLKRQLKKMELKIADSQEQRQRLAESLKKSEKPKSNLPPRRPISAQKQPSSLENQAQALRRQQNQLKMKRQIEQANRQMVQLNERYQFNKQKMQERCRKLQEQNDRLSLSNDQLSSQISALRSNEPNKKIRIGKPLSRDEIQYHLSVNQEIVEGRAHDYQSRLAECEAKLVQAEQKLANYKLLFEKTRKERDNLRLLIEQKNQEYQLCKQNEQKYEQVKRLSEQKIMELKYSYQSNEFQIRKIQNQIERLLSEREEMLSEKQSFELRMNQLIQLKDQQIQQGKRLLGDQQAASQVLQHEMQHLEKKAEMQIMSMEQEKKYLAKCLQIAQEQASKNRVKYESELSDCRSRCEKYAKEVQECKQDFTLQRQILRNKVSEYSQITQAVPALTEDAEKQQLRRQLEMANEQLANNLRNSENQKREARRYIEKTINEAQMQSALYNEQKRILREEIERARNEEYAINQDKIRKLREDIQALRAENERLTSIIDENEVSFNQLVSEHKEMHQGIKQLQEHSSQLQSAVTLSQSEKQQLSSKLQQLQQKLADFENKVIVAINEGQAKEEQQMRSSQSVIAKLETTVFSLNQQKAFLVAKNSQQARQLIDMQKEIIGLQAETRLNQQQMNSNKSNRGDYSKYLQQKIQALEQEACSLQQKQGQLMKTIQNLRRTLTNYENELQRQTTSKRDQEIKLTITKNGLQKQLSKRNQIINQLQRALSSKDNEIIGLKNQYEQRNNMEAHARVIELQAANHKLLLESYRLKSIVQQYNRSKMLFKQKMQENHKISLQNKRLLNKILMVQQQSKLIQQKYLKSQSDAHLLQKKLQQSLLNETLSNRAEQRAIDKSFKDELLWCQQQMKQKQDQIHQLRTRQNQLQASLKRSEQTISQLTIKQQRFYRENYLLQDAKRQIRSMEQQLHHERSLRRTVQEELKVQTNKKMQQIAYLQTRNQQLYQENSSLVNKVASSSNYEHEFLLQIAKQLDQSYEVQGEQQEIELRILQKISMQISELIELNAKLKQKCQHQQSRAHNPTANPQISLLASIKYMFYDLTAFLSNHRSIKPQQLPSVPHQTNPQKLIAQLGPLLKGLFSSFIKKNEQHFLKT